MSIPESHLPATFGLNRNELRRLRQEYLNPDVDFRIEKKRVEWLPCGVEKIREILKLDVGKSAPAESVAQPAMLPEPEILHVWNPRLKNKKILLAYRPGTDPNDAKNLLRVRVRNSDNFVRFVNGKPMELKARHIQADLYELATPCPRWKGRW